MVLNLNDLSPDLTKKLNRIAEQNKNSYIEFMDQVARKCNNRFWWATPLSSRNISLCDSFLDFCKLKLILEEIESYDYDTVIVSKVCLKKAIKKNIRKNIKVKVKKTIKEQVKEIFFPIYLLRNVILFWAKINVVKRNSSRFKEYNINDATVFVNTYYILSEFSKGKYEDRYFPGLNTDNLIFIALMSFDSLKEGQLLAKNVNSLEKTIILEKYVQLKDLREVIKYAFLSTNKLMIRKCCCNNINVEAIIEDSINYGKTNLNSYYGIVYAEVIKRILKHYNIVSNTMIFWYEGQPCSNYILKTIRDNFDNIKTKAYCLTPMPEHNIELYPTKEQIRLKACAYIYNIQGKLWEQAVKQFDQKVNCEIAPSFRHNHIFHEHIYLNSSEEALLVVLPIDINISSEFINVILKAVAYCNIRFIMIKNHPSNSRYTIRDYLGYDIGEELNVSYIDESIEIAVKKASCVLLCDTTAVLEIALMGIPFMVYNPKGYLSKLCDPMNVMGISENNVFYNETELIDGLRNVSNKKINIVDLEKIKRELFCEVTENSVRKFVV